MHVPPCLWEKLIHKWRRTLLAPPFLSVNNSQSCSIHNDGFPLHVKVQVQAWQVSRIARVTCAYDSFHTHTQNRIFLMHFCPFLGSEYGQYFYNCRYKTKLLHVLVHICCITTHLPLIGDPLLYRYMLLVSCVPNCVTILLIYVSICMHDRAFHLKPSIINLAIKGPWSSTSISI